MAISAKKGVQDLVEICVQKGVHQFVISPGSRNAPLTISLAEHPQIETLIIPDERAAAFFAMGMAQQSRKPVGIVCTSGSAALNYAPAVAEAYYQKIPMLVITADRPTEWVDQGDGQTIRQENVYANYIRKSFQLPQDPSDKQGLWHNSRLISEAIDIATVKGNEGPIHLNMPFSEPLYDTVDSPAQSPKVISVAETTAHLTERSWKQLAEEWNKASRKMILVGQMQYDSELEKALERLAEDKSVTVLTETTSNVQSSLFNPSIDRLLVAMDDEQAYQPDLLITFGGAIISKKIKAYLRQHKPAAHWHISEHGLHIDTFQALTTNVPVTPAYFLAELPQYITLNTTATYFSKWKALDLQLKQRHIKYCETVPFSDFSVVEKAFKAVPANSDLQLANSTAVRYAQFFSAAEGVRQYSNRGTSGIDGATSTSVGACYESKRLTTLITGDVSFFYDSNAFWNKYVPTNLKIVLINNAGGGIFRIIEGPSSSNQLEEYFEARHSTNAADLAKAYNLNYIACQEDENLEEAMQELFAKNDKATILEVHTPTQENDIVLKNYFKYLKTGKN